MAMGISSYTAFDKVFESLASAAKYLSPFYYQLVAELLVRKHRSDEVRRRSAKGGGAQSQRSVELCGAESSLEFQRLSEGGATISMKRCALTRAGRTCGTTKPGLAAFGQGLRKLSFLLRK